MRLLGPSTYKLDLSPTISVEVQTDFTKFLGTISALSLRTSGLSMVYVGHSFVILPYKLVIVPTNNLRG